MKWSEYAKRNNYFQSTEEKQKKMHVDYFNKNIAPKVGSEYMDESINNFKTKVKTWRDENKGSENPYIIETGPNKMTSADRDLTNLAIGKFHKVQDGIREERVNREMTRALEIKDFQENPQGMGTAFESGFENSALRKLGKSKGTMDLMEADDPMLYEPKGNLEAFAQFAGSMFGDLPLYVMPGAGVVLPAAIQGGLNSVADVKMSKNGDYNLDDYRKVAIGTAGGALQGLIGKQTMKYVGLANSIGGKAVKGTVGLGAEIGAGLGTQYAITGEAPTSKQVADVLKVSLLMRAPGIAAAGAKFGAHGITKGTRKFSDARSRYKHALELSKKIDMEPKAIYKELLKPDGAERVAVAIKQADDAALYKGIEYAKKGIDTAVNDVGVNVREQTINNYMVSRGYEPTPENYQTVFNHDVDSRGLRIVGGDERMAKYGDPYKVVDIQTGKRKFTKVKEIVNDRMKAKFGDDSPSLFPGMDDAEGTLQTVRKQVGEDTYQPVYEANVNAFKEIPKWENPPSVLQNLQNNYRTLEGMGEGIYHLGVTQRREAEHGYSYASRMKPIEMRQEIEAISGLRVTPELGDKVGTYLAFQQPEAIPALEKMGLRMPEMSEAEMVVANTMTKRYEAYLTQLNGARALSGEAPIVSSNPGEYQTIIRKLDRAEQLGINISKADPDVIKAIDLNDNAGQGVSFRFAKERKWGDRAIETNAFDIHDTYVKGAMRYTHMAPWVSSMRRHLEASGINETNPHAFNYINKYLDYEAGIVKSITSDHPGFEKAVGVLTKNHALAILGLNVQSIMSQPAAFHNTIGAIGPQYTAVGAKRALSPSNYKFAIKNSNVLEGRFFDVNMKDLEGATYTKFQKARSKVSDIALTPMKSVDLATATATWWGAYEQAKAGASPFSFKKGNKASHLEAITYADDIVVRTQAGASRGDLAPIQRTPLGKAATMFQTYSINQFNTILRDILGFKNKNVSASLAAKKVAAYAVFGAAMNEAYSAAGEEANMDETLGPFMSGAFKFRSPNPAPIDAYMKAIEEGRSPVEASRRALVEIMQVVPVVGGAVRYGPSSLGGAMVSTATDIMGRIGADDKKYNPGVKSVPEVVAGTVGRALGVPGTSAVIKGARNIRRYDAKQERLRKESDPMYQIRKMEREMTKDYYKSINEMLKD